MAGTRCPLAQYTSPVRVAAILLPLTLLLAGCQKHAAHPAAGAATTPNADIVTAADAPSRIGQAIRTLASAA